MNFDEYVGFDALALGDLVNNREVTARELTDIAIDAIERLDGDINAVVVPTFADARQLADSYSSSGPFAGVPFLVKDMVTSWAGRPQTWGSEYLKDLVSPADMVVTARTRDAGFIPLGNTHCPEMGWCLSSESSLYGVTNNPWAPGVSAGGSSGGSAAAVAAGFVPVADASDAAGSIRIPASYNGLVGLKPSRGLITLGPDICDFFYGGAQILCVSRTIRDTAAFLDAVAGSLPGDPYAVAPPHASFLQILSEPVPARRLGVITTAPDGTALDPEVFAAVKSAAEKLEALGHSVEPLAFTFEFDTAWAAYCDVVAVQTAGVFEVFTQILGAASPEQLTPVLQAQIERGQSKTGIEHLVDVETTRRSARNIAADVAPFDAVIMATTSQLPRMLGSWSMQEPDIDTYNQGMGKDAACVVPFNISGMPAMSVPGHPSAAGLPIGVQLAASHGDDALVLQLGRQLEQADPWIDRRPLTLPRAKQGTNTTNPEEGK